MNGKQARNLRKLVREDMGQLPLVQYEEKNLHTRWLNTGVLNLDGTPKMVPFTTSTRELGGCQRKAYQKAKKLHHLFHGR